jgi:hypothetical protein
VNLSFVPANLYLKEASDGTYIVSLDDKEILRTSSEKRAVTKFNQLRKQAELQFPTRELSAEEKAELLHQSIADSLIGHNSFKPQEKKKRPGSTRTFG